MFFLVIVQIFVEALLLRIVLKLIARHEADVSWPKVAMVVSGVLFGGLAAKMLLINSVPPGMEWLMFGVDIGLATLLIMIFCWVSFLKSVAVVFLYSACHVLLSIGVLAFMGGNIFDPEESALRGMVATERDRPSAPKETPAPKKPAPSGDVDIDLGFFKQFLDQAGGPGGAAPESKPEEEEAAYSPGWEGAEERLKVSGIMSTAEGQWEALVNGRVVSGGQYVRVDHEGKTYRFRVKAIAREQVQWERVDVE